MYGVAVAGWLPQMRSLRSTAKLTIPLFHIGCVACIVRPGVCLDEVQGVFESVSPKAVVVHPDTLSTVSVVWDGGEPDIPMLSISAKDQSLEGVPLHFLSDYIQDDIEDCLPKVDPETPAFLLQTSGTTGTPKRVNLTQVYYS